LENGPGLRSSGRWTWLKTSPAFVLESFYFDWNHIGSDLLAVVRSVYPDTKKKIVGVGHSGGAAAL